MELSEFLHHAGLDLNEGKFRESLRSGEADVASLLRLSFQYDCVPAFAEVAKAMGTVPLDMGKGGILASAITVCLSDDLEVSKHIVANYPLEERHLVNGRLAAVFSNKPDAYSFLLPLSEIKKKEFVFAFGRGKGKIIELLSSHLKSGWGGLDVPTDWVEEAAAETAKTGSSSGLMALFERCDTNTIDVRSLFVSGVRGGSVNYVARIHREFLDDEEFADKDVLLNLLKESVRPKMIEWVLSKCSSLRGDRDYDALLREKMSGLLQLGFPVPPAVSSELSLSEAAMLSEKKPGSLLPTRRQGI